MREGRIGEQCTADKSSEAEKAEQTGGEERRGAEHGRAVADDRV